MIASAVRFRRKRNSRFTFKLSRVSFARQIREFFRDPMRNETIYERSFLFIACGKYLSVRQDRMYNYSGYTTNGCRRNSLPIIDGLRRFSGLSSLFKRTYQTREDLADCIASRCCDIADTFANENISVEHTSLIPPKFPRDERKIEHSDSLINSLSRVAWNQIQ